jgi:histidine triad (HIT) family protein
MDIMPRCLGHTLVIPKAPVRNIFDASAVQLAACIKTAQKVGAAAMKAFAADGLTLLQANEGAGGQVVFHLHFHVMPRWHGKPLGAPASAMEQAEVLAASAERIRQALAS